MNPYPLAEELLAPVLRVAMPRAARLASPASALVLPCSALGPMVFSPSPGPSGRIQSP